MEEITQPQIKGNFDWINPPQVSTSFVSGEEVRAVYEYMRETFGEGVVWYDEESKTMMGSNFPIAARLDSMFRPKKIRVVNLVDVSRPEVMRMIEGKHYTVTPELALKTEHGHYAPNESLIKKLLPHIEEKQGRLKLPVKISGLDVVSDNNDYGWNILPRDDFNVVYSDKLEGKYNGQRFSKLDELGLPIFYKIGKRVWYSGDKGLSGFYLNSFLILGSGGERLAFSDDIGRVVLVRGEAAPR